MTYLHRVEIATWLVGIALLLTYVAIRGLASHASLEGTSAFQQLKAYLVVIQSTETKQVNPEVNRLDLPQPNTSSWSLARVAAYHERVSLQKAPEAVLRIPQLGLSVPVFYGISELNLNRGAGHIEGTSGIGEGGNIGIAAHRDGYFRALKDIRIGEILYLDTPTKNFVYRVVSTKIVVPAAVEVLAETTIPTITLVTCYPFYFIGPAPERFIVQAQLIPKQ